MSLIIKLVFFFYSSSFFYSFLSGVRDILVSSAYHEVEAIQQPAKKLNKSFGYGSDLVLGE